MSSTVVVADDHPVVRAGIRRILEQQRDLDVVGEASDGQEALERLLDQEPDLGILDLEMPKMTGIEVARQVRESGLRTLLVVLSVHASGAMVRRALEAGVAGYVLKTGDLAEIATALQSVRAGERYLCAALMDGVLDEISEPSLGPQGLAHLTPRERQVLTLIAEGLSSAEIAERLGVAVKTVNTHRWHLMEKLDIHKVSGLVRYAIREGLVVA